ncbi:MAG: metalloregulator ArsR/SmtB family transcription factor [Sulfuricurvum sp.]|nr:metalloregulator ArsR/SmtB family transcription factor [Sulfuricurvum sp.]MDD5387243.1 metalloregulator ArsR/SmtB family transcription factor [Sulfuricurvum sp.]
MLDMQQKLKIFKALSNETRFLIFKNVFTGGYTCSLDKKQTGIEVNPIATCVSTVAEHFNFSLPTISAHIKELKEAKIITVEKKGNKVYIEPNIETIREMSACFQTLITNFDNNRELFFNDTVTVK